MKTKSRELLLLLQQEKKLLVSISRNLVDPAKFVVRAYRCFEWLSHTIATRERPHKQLLFVTVDSSVMPVA